MTYACPLCGEPKDGGLNPVAKHLVHSGSSRNGVDHTHVETYAEAWAVLLEEYDVEVPQAVNEWSDFEPTEDGDDGTAPSSARGDGGGEGVTVLDVDGGERDRADPSDLEDDSGGGCPECGGELTEELAGERVQGTVEGSPETWALDESDGWCPDCELVVASDGRVMR